MFALKFHSKRVALVDVVTYCDNILLILLLFNTELVWGCGRNYNIDVIILYEYFMRKI